MRALRLLSVLLVLGLVAPAASAQPSVDHPRLLTPTDLDPAAASQPPVGAFEVQDWLPRETPSAVLPPSAAPFAAARWSALQPVVVDPRPSLQSAPAVAALPDGSAFAVWMDSRNALPDVYGAHWFAGLLPVVPIEGRRAHRSGGPVPETLALEVRVGHRRPHFNVPGLRHAAVAGENGRTFVVWADEAQVYVVRGDLSSGTWTSPTTIVQVTQWEAVTAQPKVATDGSGNLVVVWTDFRESDGRVRVGDIYATRCNGNTTPIACSGTATRLNDDSGAKNIQRAPAISRRGNQVVVVWEDGREAGADYPRIYASFSNDGGQTWGANVRVNKRLDGGAPGARDAATHPAVTHAADGTVWVAWEHRTGAPTAAPDIYVARWDGSQWSTPWRVDGAPPRVRSVAPTIAALGDEVFVAWQDHRTGHVKSRIYTARWNGNAWTEPSAVTASGLQRAPMLSAAGNKLYLVWEDNRDGQADVYGTAWMGDGWDSPLQLNTPAERLPYQISPALASLNGQTFALFADRRESYVQLHFARQTGFGPWQAAPTPPTGAEVGVSVAPERVNLATDQSGQLHAVWADGQWPRGWRVRHSVFNGTAWTDPVFVARQITSNESLPSFAVHGNALVASWSRWHRLDNGDVRVQLYASWNTGAGWVTETAILTQTFSAWNWPTSAATDGNFLYVAWHREDANNGRGRIWLARRPLQPEASWSYAQINPPHSDDWCYHRHPRLAVDDGGTLHAVWLGCARRNQNASWPRDYYIFHASSGDRGETWSAPLRVHLVSPDSYFDAHPTLALAPGGRAMVVYPVRLGANREFAAALIQNGSVVFTRTLTTSAAWVPAGSYEGLWYGGDGAGSVTYDPAFDRFVVAVVDRSNGRAPRILTAAYHLNPDFFPRVFLPAIQR